MELGASDLRIGIDERLLVNSTNALQIADIERILGAAITRMLALELAMGLLLGEAPTVSHSVSPLVSAAFMASPRLCLAWMAFPHPRVSRLSAA